MAYTPRWRMRRGQLPQVRWQANKNLEQVVTETALASFTEVGSGMGLTKFRLVMNDNIDLINTALATSYGYLESGDTVWRCREKLRAMFEDIGANDV